MRSKALFVLNIAAITSLPTEQFTEVELSRDRRQAEVTNTVANCDFGSGASVDTCGWDNLDNVTALRWTPSKGDDAFWIGGPRHDHNEPNTFSGGYVFLETSSLAEGEQDTKGSALMESPLLTTTGSKGHCVTFSYAISGLSADRLRVLLHPVNLDTDPDAPNFNNDVVLATLIDDTLDHWKEAQVLYTYPEEHTLLFEAIPKAESDQARRYRGFIAIDDVKFKSGDECKGHCTFDSGLCKFSNDQNGNFEWQVGRGSNNPNTGPQRDHASFATNRVTGAFAYIDAGHPRRPGDKALLMSEEFPATVEDAGGPLCLRFWTHMFGHGVGSLNVYVRAGAKDRKIWGLTGDAGNNWYMGQAPIASTDNFRIVFEGVVGRNGLGNIAIDDISIAPGVCPTAPQVAAASPGDCSFEDDECGWQNPGQRDAVDEIQWERKSAEVDGVRFPVRDHTTGNEGGFYMHLSHDNIQKAGDRAFFVSQEMDGSRRERCMSFWYYMYEPIVDTSGPNLGTLTIWTRTIDTSDQLVMTPVWRLSNGHGPSWHFGQAQVTTDTSFQVIIEGIWGTPRASGYLAVDDVTFYDGECGALPATASVTRGACSFDRDSCGWRNTSTAETFDWRMATLTKRPANLPDKTYGAPVGYAYFDIFNTGSRSNIVKMISPTIPGTPQTPKLCFSFWFAAFGAGDSTSLRIYQKPVGAADNDDDEEDSQPSIWFLNAESLDTARPEWQPGQVTLDTARDFRIYLEGKASNGGFAIDQLTFYPGECPNRPENTRNVPRN